MTYSSNARFIHDNGYVVKSTVSHKHRCVASSYGFYENINDFRIKCIKIYGGNNVFCITSNTKQYKENENFWIYNTTANIYYLLNGLGIYSSKHTAKKSELQEISQISQ